MATMRKAKKSDRLKLSVDVNPKVKKALRIAVARGDSKVKDEVHVALCRHLKLEHLIAEGVNP